MGAHQLQKEAVEEGIAIGFLREIGSPEPPICAFELAYAARLRVVYGTPARLEGSTIYVPRKAPWQRQQWLVAHELGHWLLARAGELQSERSADLVAAALLAPRDALYRGVRAFRGDLVAVAAQHPNCPPQWVARRVQLITS